MLSPYQFVTLNQQFICKQFIFLHKIHITTPLVVSFINDYFEMSPVDNKGLSHNKHEAGIYSVDKPGQTTPIRYIAVDYESAQNLNIIAIF